MYVSGGMGHSNVNLTIFLGFSYKAASHKKRKTLYLVTTSFLVNGRFDMTNLALVSFKGEQLLVDFLWPIFVKLDAWSSF